MQVSVFRFPDCLQWEEITAEMMCIYQMNVLG